MKFSAALFTTAVLATSALAAPLTEKRQARHEARAKGGNGRKTLPPQSKHKTELQEQYSSNWAGAVLVNSGYTGVSAQFTVPTPQMPSGRHTNQHLSLSSFIWVN